MKPKTLEAMNKDLTYPAVKVQWAGANVILWSEEGRQLTSFHAEDAIGKITRWCVKNSYRAPQIHDGRIWL